MKKHGIKGAFTTMLALAVMTGTALAGSSLTDQEIMERVWEGPTVPASQCQHLHLVKSESSVGGWSAYDDNTHGETGMFYYSLCDADYCLDCGQQVLNGRVLPEDPERYDGWEFGDMDTYALQPHSLGGDGVCTVCGYRQGTMPAAEDSGADYDLGYDDYNFLDNYYEDYDVDFSMIYPLDG